MTSGRAAFGMLAGGRSVALHRYALRRAAAPLNFSRRACAWIKELLGPAPTLSTDLSYGPCLPELAAAFRAPVGSRGEVRPGFHGIGERRHEGREVREKPRDAQCPPGRAASFRPAATSGDDARHCLRPLSARADRVTGWSDVSQVPPRAEATLLRRLSGESELSQTESAPRELRLFSRDGSPKQERPSFPQSAASEKKWLGDMAERAAAVLRRHIRDATARPSHGQIAARGESQRQARGVTSWENGESRVPAVGSSSVAEQWSIDLHGQTAPAELLARLTSVAFQGGQEVRGTGSSAQPGPGGAEGAFEILGSSRTVDVAATSATPGMSADAARDGAGQSASELARLRERNIGFPDSILAGPESIPLAPSLPAMLLSQSTERPEPNVAAAMVRQSVRTDEIRRQERPEELAERIRHILQEEARRHGIDV